MSPMLAIVCFLQCILIVLSTSEDDKKFFLQAHNDLRRQVATGKTPNQPAAADMLEMVWDEELAKKAEIWAGKCKGGHDSYEDRKVAKFKFVGQNMYGGGKIKDVVQGWFNEFKDYDYKSKKCRGTCGHYTQVAWAKSYALGCAAVDCGKKYTYGWLFICNYGPAGNFNNEAPYLTGAACSKCPANSSCKNSLCAAGKLKRSDETRKRAVSNRVI